MAANNTLLGTPLYLAPEAITNHELVSAQTDLYALGAVAYQLLTGLPPFDGETVIDVCSKHLLVEPTPPSEATTWPIPPAVDELVLACLAKSPEMRPRSAQALREQLETIALTEPWTAARARAWWTEEAPALVTSARTNQRAGRESSPATVAIDLKGRARTGV